MRRKRITAILTGIVIALAGFAPNCLAQPDRYFEYIKETAEQQWDVYPTVIENWKRNVNPSSLWGYDSPAHPIYLADVLGFMYEQTGDEEYARKASILLSEYGDLRNVYPPDYRNTRIEYEDGIPSLSNFFFLPPYSRSYMRIRNSNVMDDATRRKIEEDLAHSLDFVFHFPEWGAHNRAMLRAEGLYYGYIAMPGHPNAPLWKKMAETIASDNLNQWEVEDATHYQPIWLMALFSYADISENESLFDSPLMRYNAEYFKQLFTPAMNMPDLGDANWNPSPERYIAVLERFSKEYDDPELKWVARQYFDQMYGSTASRNVGVASALTEAYHWSNDSTNPKKPDGTSTEVLEDVIGKKIVFRNGWDANSTYLLLNYRDEGDGGVIHREFLRNTLSVEEEKMHHGQADENDIALLMDGGSVLLHGSGYRDGLPSGPFGGYRADYYHNRMVVRKGKRDTHQTVPEYVRNSGAYQPVETRKIDFLTFEEVEMSRTRLIDAQLGYEWDRHIVYLKRMETFVVIDAVRATETDYFTYTNFWYTRKVHASGPGWYDTSIDSIRAVALPTDRRLLIQMLDRNAKFDSTFSQSRHFQPEIGIYQSKSSHYLEDSYEVFVTVLMPHEADQPVESLLNRIKLLPTTGDLSHVGLEVSSGEQTAVIGIKVDLRSELLMRIKSRKRA